MLPKNKLTNRILVFSIIFILIITPLSSAKIQNSITEIAHKDTNRDINWDVTLFCTESYRHIDNSIFGEAPDASYGFDLYDAADPGGPPTSPYLNCYFTTPSPYPSNKLMQKIKHYSLNNTYKVWNFSVFWFPADYVTPTTTTISWVIDEVNDSEHTNVSLCTSDGVFLTNMLMSSYYSFYNPAMIPQNFKIICLGNLPPNEPGSPSPANGSTNVSVDVDLGWTGGDPDPGDSVTYDVYFGIRSPPKVVNNQSGLSFHPGILQYQTTYYWQVIAWDCFGGSISSILWSFTTKASGNISQEPGDTNQTNAPPVADASFSQRTGFIGSFVILNGSGSYDADGFLTRWFWDFGDGTQGTGERTIHAYQAFGVYTVVLTVTDDKGASGTDSILIDIGIANYPPTKPVIAGTRIGTKHIIYTYTVSATDPENDFLQYRMSWGDGTFNETQFVPNGTVSSFSHSWDASGKYVLTATATDNTTVSSQSTVEVFIDVRFIQDRGFLFDARSDGLFDSFYSNTTSKITSVHRLENGSYLLDTDGDGKWNYLYDPNTESLTLVGFGVATIENPWLFIIIIMAAFIIIIIIVYLYKKNYF